MAIRNIATLLYLFLSHLASSQGSNATLSITTEVDQPFSQTTLTTPTSWQYGLSLAESNKYMLDHQLDTDIVFRVGSRHQAPSLIRAHRYVLMSRSDVFTQLLRQNNSDNNSMLRSGGHSMQTIDIPDMDPDVFRELINYVYTGNATVNLDNAIPLIYAAKRFQQPNLSKLCLEMLQRSISIENVYLILSKAVYLKEEPLINKTLEFIGLKAEQVLNSDEVLNLSREIFTLVISYDGLDTNETLIFETSMRWVKAQMSKNNLITSLEIDKIEIARRVFGDLIYRIRFPIMDPKECAELVGASDLLTCEEKYSIFRYISTSDHMNYTLKFDHEKRVRTRFIDRFDNSFERKHGSHDKEPKIQFNVSKSIILKAVGTYGFSNFHFSDRLPMNNTVTVTLSRSSQKYLQRGHSEQIMVEVQNYTWTRTRELKKDHIFKIPIPGDVRLEPNAFYTIAVEIIPGPNDPHYVRDNYYFTSFGSNSRGASINDGDVVFTFNDNNNTPYHQIYGYQGHGQIPRLYYY